MLGIHDYWLFVITGVLLNLTPGQDTFFILGRSIAHGPRAGVAAAFGIAAGSLIHTVLAALGLSAILATSDSAFLIVKLAGAAYLIWMGAGMLFARRGTSQPLAGGAAGGLHTAFRDGTVTNLLNPKVALFFLALMPQFIAPESSRKALAFIALGCTFVLTGVLWCTTLALAAGSIRRYFERNPRTMGGLSRSAGALFMGLGLRLAVSRN